MVLPLHPLQFVGMPGGVELLVIGLVLLLLFGIPLAIVVVVGVLWLRSNERAGPTQERVEELEREVELLREELDAAIDGGDGPEPHDTAASGSKVGEDTE